MPDSVAQFLGIMVLAVILLIALIAEIYLRWSGFGRFPLYVVDARCGYRMKSGQRGVFRNRTAWAYDDRGMRFDGQLATLAGANVLVGDSVVDGGLQYPQDETLAARLQAALGEVVYPVACPGWALANELGALTSIEGWQHAKRLVLVLNTGDFDEVGIADSELSFPTRYPWWLLMWLVRRQLYRNRPRWWPGKGRPITLEVSPGLRADNLARFREVVDHFRGQIIIVRYPRRNENPSTDPFFASLRACDANIRMVDVNEAAEWSEQCYIDHIHPNAMGVAILFDHILEGAF